MPRAKKAEIDTPVPVIILWKGILLLPVFGIVDSKRAQDIMETGLENIRAHDSKIMILDIRSVPTVDTAVANHLIKIAKATKLMGCECIISGISSGIAQTLVQLGIDIGDIITEATLRDALELAFVRLGLEVREITKK
jgi:rsbT co-antagonist protein RsbR